MRAPLRLLGAALAVTAALVFLQTFVLRAIPPDASWFGGAAQSFRVAFVIADVATIVALVRLGRRASSVRPFTTFASIMLALTVLSAAVGVLFGGSSRSGGRPSLGAIEPMLTFGATILMAFALAPVLGPNAAPDRRRNGVFAAALACAVLVLLMRLGSGATHEAPNMLVAWLRWVLAVAQAASLATFAFLLARANEAGDEPSPDALAAAADGGGYRAAGKSALAAPRLELAAPGPATIEPMRRASSGIEMHRTAFIMRVCIAGAMIVLAFSVGEELATIGTALFGAGTATVIAVGVSRQRSLATFDRGPSMLAAQIAFIVTTVSEVAALLWSVGELAFRLHMPAGIFAFFLGAVSSVLGLLFVSRAYERAGDLLSRPRLARLARWTQGILVLAVTSFLAMFAEDGLGLLSALLFLFSMLGCAVAGVVVHVMTLNEANRVLKDRLEKATNPTEVNA